MTPMLPVPPCPSTFLLRCTQIGVTEGCHSVGSPLCRIAEAWQPSRVRYIVMRCSPLRHAETHE
ncbi:hypothetical protein E2C01_098248 [Portunus trituberculatus]|uniref:Uncharacterized protein n=1 Tax=Portunus trituberculatus TaxID=210409 RepID=A0A5B7JXC2_PORTR|nr:hypothetical protein [Portunus trituberculatus]